MDALERFGDTLAVLYRDGPRQPLDRFHHWMFEALKALIEFDAGFWGVGAWAENGEPVVRNIHLHGRPATMTHDWDAMKTDSAHQAILGKIAAAKGSVVLGPEDLNADPLFSKYDVASLVTIWIMDPTTRLLYIFSFYRSTGHPPFGEMERRLHQALVPHLFEIERKVWLRQFSIPSARNSGVSDNQALCDGEGTLRLVQEGFVRAMLTEWPSWQGPTIPETLLDPVRRKQDREVVGERTVVAVARQHDMFILTARERGPIDALSPREKIVAQKWGRGYSYKEIAARMEISPATVRNHVARIYDKLAVTGRQQLSEALGERG